jgi:hypothetical protein
MGNRWDHPFCNTLCCEPHLNGPQLDLPPIQHLEPQPIQPPQPLQPLPPPPLNLTFHDRYVSTDAFDVWSTMFDSKETIFVNDYNTVLLAMAPNSGWRRFDNLVCDSIHQPVGCDFILGFKSKGDQDVKITRIRGLTCIDTITIDQIKTHGKLTNNNTYYFKFNIPLNVGSIDDDPILFSNVINLKCGFTRVRKYWTNSYVALPLVNSEYVIDNGGIFLHRRNHQLSDQRIVKLEADIKRIQDTLDYVWSKGAWTDEFLRVVREVPTENRVIVSSSSSLT